MILIYRIQRGTVDMESNDLAQALMEAKSQLPIFEVQKYLLNYFNNSVFVVIVGDY